MSPWHDTASKLDDIYLGDPLLARRQIKNQPQLLVLNRTYHKFLPIRRLVDGISGRDMSARKCLAQEVQRYRHELRNSGFREVSAGDVEHQELLDQLTSFLEIEFQTKPSPSEKTFWVEKTITRDAVMRAFQEYDDHGIPAGFREAQKWFVSNPKTQAPYPAKIIWGIATNAKGSDFKSFEARVGLKKAGFECADLSKSPPNHNGRRYLEEGAVRSSIRSSRERNPVARALCIEHYRKMNNGNLVCTICHFDFAVAYGPLGEGFMHVHHLNPISEAKDTRRVSPEIDLVPVCPNCHAMIHRGGETRSIVEILRILTQS